MSDYDELRVHIPKFGDEPPYDLSGATNWERQEITQAWRDASRFSAICAQMGAYYNNMLTETGGQFAPDGYVGDLDMCGEFQPNFIASRFVVAATRLRHLMQGMQHRIAIEEKEIGL